MALEPFNTTFELSRYRLLKGEDRLLGDIIKKNFFLKMTLLPLILCEESIARIPEPWKRFPDPDSRK